MLMELMGKNLLGVPLWPLFKAAFLGIMGGTGF